MALIAIGGFPGAGKTTLCRRLSSELNLPCLSSDTIGRTIEDSSGIKSGRIDAYRVAYDVLFRLCEEFIRTSASVILDLTLGWDFQWRKLNGILERHPQTLFLPVVLQCSHELCLERLEARHRAMPEAYAAPSYFRNERKVHDIWRYLQELDRPEVCFVDASGDEDQVYQQVKHYVTNRIQHAGDCVEGGGLVMGFAYEAFARRRFKKGRKEGIRERDEKYAAWIAEERKKGEQGFKEDPPFIRNGSED